MPEATQKDLSHPLLMRSESQEPTTNYCRLPGSEPTNNQKGHLFPPKVLGKRVGQEYIFVNYAQRKTKVLAGVVAGI